MADEPSPVMNHDALVRRALGDPATARAWLQARLPEAVAQHLNFATLQRMPGSFVDEALQRSETDVLFEARGASGLPVHVYVLVEHQSTVDFWLRLRLLRYQSRIWEEERTRRPRADTISPIVTVVLHHGPRSWSPSTRFADLYNEKVRDLPGVCRFRHVLVELHRMPLEEARGDAYSRAMEMLLSDHGRTQAARLVQLLTPLLPTIRATPGGPSKVITLVRYYTIEYGGPMKEVLTAEVAKYQERHGEVGLTREDVTMLEILEAKLEREGRAKGLQEGLKAGREEGRQEGLEVGLEVGRLQERIANLEGLLERSHSWEAVEALTGIDEAGLHKLREELDRLQGNNDSNVD